MLNNLSAKDDKAEIVEDMLTNQLGSLHLESETIFTQALVSTPTKPDVFANFGNKSALSGFTLEFLSRHMRATFNFPQSGVVIFFAVAAAIASEASKNGLKNISTFKQRLFSPTANSEEFDYVKIKRFVENHYEKIGLTGLKIPIEKYAYMYQYHFQLGMLKFIEAIGDCSDHHKPVCLNHLLNMRESEHSMGKRLEAIFDDLFCMSIDSFKDASDLLEQKLLTIFRDNKIHQISRSLVPQLKKATKKDWKIIINHNSTRLSKRVDALFGID